MKARLMALLTGMFVLALVMTTSAGNKLQHGHVDSDDGGTLSSSIGIIPTGGLLAYGGASAPSGYLLCDGSAVSRTTYAALFAVLGIAYGPDDGSTTFNVPDLRGRSPLGSGQGTGLSNRSIGQIGGEETHAQTTAELAAHTHTATVTDPGHGHHYDGGSTAGTGARALRATDLQTDGMTTTVDQTGISVSNATTGNGTAFNVMNPFIVTNFIIKT